MMGGIMKRFPLFFAMMAVSTLLAMSLSAPSNADVSPKYPAKQHRKGIEGCVLAELKITPKGKVRNVKVLQDLGNFGKHTKSFLWKLRYSPEGEQIDIPPFQTYVEYRLIDRSMTDDAGIPRLSDFICPFEPTDDTTKIVITGSGKWVENRDGTFSWQAAR